MLHVLDIYERSLFWKTNLIVIKIARLWNDGNNLIVFQFNKTYVFLPKELKYNFFY
jgi:hypothetical protein